MIEKKTVRNSLNFTRNGTAELQLGLLLIEDGIEIDSKWHRTAFPPGHDVTAQIAAVNAHLAQMGKEPVSEADAAYITAMCAQAWTPEVVAAYQASQTQGDPA